MVPTGGRPFQLLALPQASGARGLRRGGGRRGRWLALLLSLGVSHAGQEVADRWYDEIKNYNFQQPGFTSGTGEWLGHHGRPGRWGSEEPTPESDHFLLSYLSHRSPISCCQRVQPCFPNTHTRTHTHRHRHRNNTYPSLVSQTYIPQT